MGKGLIYKDSASPRIYKLGLLNSSQTCLKGRVRNGLCMVEDTLEEKLRCLALSLHTDVGYVACVPLPHCNPGGSMHHRQQS